MKPGDSTNKPLLPSRTYVPPDQAPFPGSFGPGSGALFPAAPASAGPPGLSSSPTLGALVQALKRRWFLAFSLATLAAGIAVAVAAFLLPPKFISQTMLKLDSRQTRPILFPNAGDQEIDPAVFRATQLAVVKSSSVLNSALKSDRLKGLPISFQSVHELSKALKADFTVGPEVMTVRLSGDEPEHLADLLNAVVDAYKKEVNGGDVDRKNLIIQELDKSKQDFEKQLNDKRIELDKELGRAAPQLKVQEERLAKAGRKFDAASEDLRRNRLEISREKQKTASLKARLDKIDQERVSEREYQKAINDARAANHRLLNSMKPLFDLETKLLVEQIDWQKERQTKNVTDKLQTIHDQIEANKAKIDVELLKIRGDLEKEIRADRRDKLELEHNTHNILLKELVDADQDLKLEFEAVQADWEAAKDAQPKVKIEVQKLRDEEAQILKILDQLNAAPALIKAEPSPANKISVVEPAETPTDRDYSRMVKFGGAGALGAFGLMLLGVAFLEFRLRKVNDVEQVTQGLGMNVVGTMPKLPARARRPIANSAAPASSYWQSVINESVDAIRTQLLHAARTEAVHIVMVTSANGGEGKTSLASQLAASLARSWRKTLLVDGDLRNPAAHKLFDLPLEPGFSEVLRGEATAADAIKPTALSRLWLLPAGHWDAHAVQALAQDGVRATFDQLKEQYDFLIVDSCPVLPVADSLVLGQHVDGVLFSVLRDVSRMPAVHAAQQKLQALGVRTLGAVVIGAPCDAGSVAYNYATHARG
jgi:succinoglycan biosynthesis transport protein ExoP